MCKKVTKCFNYNNLYNVESRELRPAVNPEHLYLTSLKDPQHQYLTTCMRLSNQVLVRN